MSGDQPLTVNFVRMAEISGQISTTIDLMRNKLDDLGRHAAPLVDSWSGTAQDAYRQRQLTWGQASGELITALSSIKRALDDSMADYAATEKQNVRRFEHR